jgi:phosphatidate cytidylyltransferase
MHLKRLLTALIGLPLLIGFILLSPPSAFAVLIGIGGLMALYEYFDVVNRLLGGSALGWMSIVGYVSGTTMICAAYLNSTETMIGVLTLNLLIIALISLFRIRFEPRVLDMIFRQVLGTLYIPVFLSYLIWLRNGQDGIYWIFYLFAVVFAGDSLAFYAGTLFGRHKLIPMVSPGKTVEGSLAGLAGNVAAGLLYRAFVSIPPSWTACLLISLLIGIAAQAGDLFESQIKRSAGVKDSGRLFPGHGGVLDRFDATLFAAPVLYLMRGILD